MSPYRTIVEAAQHLKVGRSTMYRLKREIPFRDHGGRIVFHVDDLDTWSASKIKLPKPIALSKFQLARERVRSLKTEVIAHPTPQKGVG